MDFASSFHIFCAIVIFKRFLVIAYPAISDWIFVNGLVCIFMDLNLKLIYFHSIAGAYGPAFAYIGEFHTEETRSRAIMFASIILGAFTLVLPLVAWVVIDQDWIFDFPSIGFTYKPWRLFIVGCSIPSLISFIILCILPESPKFVLSQGNQAETIEILKMMHRWNCRKRDGLANIHEVYDEQKEGDETEVVRKKNLFAAVWFQTKPLFMPPHLKTTVLLSILKFIEFAGTNGVYLWIPEVLNRLATNEKHFPGERIRVCDVVYRYRPNVTYTNSEVVFSPEVKFHIWCSDALPHLHLHFQSCVTKFEVETYEQTLLLEVFYTLSFVVQALLINRIGKFPLLCQ